MISRALTLPNRSFFLLGPRGTGKSTWLRQLLPNAKWYNLLHNIELLRLSSNPNFFRQEIELLPNQSWIVVDEVQRMPTLLNEVQDLISSNQPGRYHFALTGSSARKLKRSGVNLLAGRAINRQMYTLTSDEVDFKITPEQVMRFGMLPDVYCANNEQDRIDILEAYVDTYLREEIKEEALIRKLEPFLRFLQVAALMNGQLSNLSNIGRDASIKRPTVEGHYSVLEDTLLGFWLSAWQPRAKIKEISHPKFYFFDPGVVRTLSGRLREPLEETDRGVLLETFLMNEVRAWISYRNTGGKIYYWRTPSQTEIDLVYVSGKTAVGVEIKSSLKWKREFSRPLKELIFEKKIKSGFGVYLGDHNLKDGKLTVLTLMSFLKKLWANEIF